MTIHSLRAYTAAAMALAIGAGVFAVPWAAAQPAALAQKTFASPEEAVTALRSAVWIHDTAALRDIFGPDAHALLTGDTKQDKANFKRFAKAMAEGAQAVPESDGTMTLEIGANRWPFPVPLIKENAVWRFDTAAGKEVIINRRIGRGELHAIAACRSFIGGSGKAPKRFHGYVFKILSVRSEGGAALEAYPEHWGRSGIMTFIVNQDGKVYQRDLGEMTSQLAAAASEYNPGGDWAPVLDQGLTEK